MIHHAWPRLSNITSTGFLRTAQYRFVTLVIRLILVSHIQGVPKKGVIRKLGSEKKMLFFLLLEQF